MKYKIIEWARARGILDSTPEKQFLKTVEELGELAVGMQKDDITLVKDALGDILVTLIILSEQTMSGHMWMLRTSHPTKYGFIDLVSNIGFVGSEIQSGRTINYTELTGCYDCLHDLAGYYDLTIEDCLKHAWDEIKDRKGEMVSGIFRRDLKQNNTNKHQEETKINTVVEHDSAEYTHLSSTKKSTSINDLELTCNCKCNLAEKDMYGVLRCCGCGLRKVLT